MPKTAGELINDLAQKAGVATDDAALKALLASPELATIQVPDTIVTSLEGGLLSLDAAKNNHPEIKKVYTALAYNGMDKHLITLLGDDTFDPADLEEIKNEKSTSRKYELVIAKLKAAKGSAKGADKDAINAQLQAANDAARIAKAELETLKSGYEAKISDIQMKAAIKAVFGNYKTIYDDLPPAAKNAAMEALISTSLQDKKAQLKTDEHGNLTLVSLDGTNVFGANNVQLTPASFLDQTFAPILKVSGPPKPTAKQPGQSTAPTYKVDEAAEATVSQISSHNASVLEQLSKPQASLV